LSIFKTHELYSKVQQLLYSAWQWSKTIYIMTFELISSCKLQMAMTLPHDPDVTVYVEIVCEWL